jgi:hypothetical protein
LFFASWIFQFTLSADRRPEDFRKKLDNPTPRKSLVSDKIRHYAMLTGRLTGDLAPDFLLLI